MRKIVNFLLLFSILLIGNTYGRDYVDGYIFDEFEIMGFDGMSAPSVSSSGDARIYFDATANKLKLSQNTGAYSNLVTEATSGIFVPYTGATSNVDLGAYNLTTTGTGTFGELVLSDDEYLYLDTAKLTYLRYSSAHAAPIMSSDGDGYWAGIEGVGFYANTGADGSGSWEPLIFVGNPVDGELGDTGLVTIRNTTTGDAGEKYLLIDMTDGIQLDTGAGRANMMAENVTGIKVFQFPDVTGTLVTTAGAGANIDLGAYTLTTDKIRANGKIFFTQADENEYIVSVYDGYIDYGATIGHWFNTMISTPEIHLADGAAITVIDGSDLDTAGDWTGLSFYGAAGFNSSNDAWLLFDDTNVWDAGGQLTVGTASVQMQFSPNASPPDLGMNANLLLKDQGELRLEEAPAGGNDYTGFKAPTALASSFLYTLPDTVGGAGEVLTDAAGDGVLSWAAAAGGGGWDGQSDLSIANGVKLKDGYLRIGSGGTVTIADGDGDLYVEDELEVDGLIRVSKRVESLVFDGDDDRAMYFRIEGTSTQDALYGIWARTYLYDNSGVAQAWGVRAEINSLGNTSGTHYLWAFDISDNVSSHSGTVNTYGCTITIDDPQATNNYGIRTRAYNASGENLALWTKGNIKYEPLTTQVINAVGDTILANSALVVLNPDGDYTLTSAPTIADGTIGQIMYIICDNAEANTVTVQDQDSLGSSNLQLGATSRAISGKDILTLIFDGTDWIEQAYANN